jgi:hypothetical protein
MKQSYGTFKYLISEINHSKAIYQYLKANKFNTIDYSDLLRWQWIQAVSALDKLVHNLVLVGMCDTYLGRRASTPAFDAFRLDFSQYIQLEKMASVEEKLQYLRNLITKTNGYKSFESPDTIAMALSSIWTEQHKWKKISDELKMPEDDVRKRLNSISMRRNQIVHEGDSQGFIFERQKISKKDTDEVIMFIKKLGMVIYRMVK